MSLSFFLPSPLPLFLTNSLLAIPHHPRQQISELLRDLRLQKKMVHLPRGFRGDEERESASKGARNITVGKWTVKGKYLRKVFCMNCIMSRKRERGNRALEREQFRARSSLKAEDGDEKER
jgi:hypothetical protein